LSHQTQIDLFVTVKGSRQVIFLNLALSFTMIGTFRQVEQVDHNFTLNIKRLKTPTTLESQNGSNTTRESVFFPILSHAQD
jgi:hypothetical protein